jgi:hypothetical protein
MLPASGVFPHDVYSGMGNKRYNVSDAGTGALLPDDSTNPVIEYPSSGADVDFVAYYPYSDKIDGNGNYDVLLTDQRYPAKIDVMVAKKLGVSNGPVQFQFGHALSKITINIKLAAGVTNITDEQVAAIEDVKLMATPGSARICIADGKIAAGSNAAIALYKDAPAKEYLATFSAIVVPGSDVTLGYLSIMFKGRPVLWSLPGDKFIAGKNHIYWGEITDSDFRVEESGIITWNENDKGQLFQSIPAKIQQNYRVTWDGDKKQYSLTNDPTNGGLYFKFGSVVGIYTAHGAVRTLPVEDENSNRDTFEAANDVAWDPTGNVTGYNGAGWATVPCYTSADFDLSPNTITPPVYHNAANVKAGKGDPCRLVGLDLDKIKKTDATALTTADIDNGKWRLPTVEENKAFTGQDESVGHTGHWTDQLYGVNGGMFPNTTLGDITTFLPAMGRRATGSGKIVNSPIGVYWTSVSDKARQYGMELHFERASIQPLRYGLINDGFTVRCVRQ